MIAIAVTATVIFPPLQLVFKRMLIPKVNMATTNDLYNKDGYKSDHGRLRLSKIGVKVIQKHWVTGVGAGRYWEVAEKYIPENINL